MESQPKKAKTEHLTQKKITDHSTKIGETSGAPELPVAIAGSSRGSTTHGTIDLTSSQDKLMQMTPDLLHGESQFIPVSCQGTEDITQSQISNITAVSDSELQLLQNIVGSDLESSGDVEDQSYQPEVEAETEYSEEEVLLQSKRAERFAKRSNSKKVRK